VVITIKEFTSIFCPVRSHDLPMTISEVICEMTFVVVFWSCFLSSALSLAVVELTLVQALGVGVVVCTSAVWLPGIYFALVPVAVGV
jgi:hypothetical protein